MLYGKHSDAAQSEQRVELAGPKFGDPLVGDIPVRKPLANLSEDHFVSVSLTALKLLRNREIECLRWVAEGKTSIEISRIIDLSEHTVNHYLAACCRKLDAVNRVQAAVKAVRLGIV
jgi:DNA-binding CsgD family transcriptional regulator